MIDKKANKPFEFDLCVCVFLSIPLVFYCRRPCHVSFGNYFTIDRTSQLRVKYVQSAERYYESYYNRQVIYYYTARCAFKNDLQQRFDRGNATCRIRINNNVIIITHTQHIGRNILIIIIIAYTHPYLPWRRLCTFRGTTLQRHVSRR